MIEHENDKQVGSSSYYCHDTYVLNLQIYTQTFNDIYEFSSRMHDFLVGCKSFCSVCFFYSREVYSFSYV